MMSFSLNALRSAGRATLRFGQPAATSQYSCASRSFASLRLGDKVPDFTADSTEGELNLYKYLGESWGVLFSHPADFTPVCTTELGRVAKLKDEFQKRDVKVLALSVDSVEDHHAWVQDVNDTQNTTVNFPIIADKDQKVAQAYDMLDHTSETTQTVRSVFVIGPDKSLKLSFTYPASTGRNFNELLRVIDSLQLTAKHKLATPENWQDGDKCVIVPAVSDAEAEALFPQGWDTIRPYLRLTTPPRLHSKAKK